MFEKEGFKWTEKNISVGISMYNPSIEMYCGKAFKDGAEFGFNKANEWHYPSKGEYPKDKKNFQNYVVAFYGAKGSYANGKPCWEELCYDTETKRWVDKETLKDLPYVNKEGIVIAWKEIVLPKESE